MNIILLLFCDEIYTKYSFVCNFRLTSYFNAALEQGQNINVTQVNPAPPTVIPEGLFNFKETTTLGDPLNLRSKLAGSRTGLTRPVLSDWSIYCTQLQEHIIVRLSLSGN